jgi:hypothetical protein
MLAQELNSLLKENISSRGPAQALFEVRRETTSLCPLTTAVVHVQLRGSALLPAYSVGIFLVVRSVSPHLDCCFVRGTGLNCMPH